MNDTRRSVLIGTAALWIVLAAAVALALARGMSAGDTGRLRALRRNLLGCVALQAAHAGEEWFAGFHRLWPARFGLAPWPVEFFVAFNVFWLLVWLACAWKIGPRRPWVLAPVWFLALAALMNGLAHPLLALAAGGYFPGLWTAPLLGVAGIRLWKELWRATGD